MRIIGILLEELDKKDHILDPTAIHSIMASQKETLSRCNSVLSCSTCVARSEYTLLLGLITQRLATSCEFTVAVYLEEVQRRYRFRSAPKNEYHSRTSLEHSQHLFLGHYEIDSLEEWSSLLRVLIVLQLRGLLNFLGEMKNIAVTGSNATQLPVLQATERRVGILIQKLRYPEPQHIECSKAGT